VHRFLTTFLLGAALAGCASGSRPRLLGDAHATLGPQLALADSLRPPRELAITLSNPASAVVLFVVPGRGAVVVYPADSVVDNRLAAGTHRVSARWPQSFLAGDTIGPELARQPDPRGRDSVLAGRTPRREGAAPRAPQLISSGYLLLVTVAEPLPWAAVRERVEGMTIPIVDDEALNAMGKAVRSVASPSAPWAGYAIDVRVR
jgi:hypothetical protein